jgi:enoyl-[acyl-carrier protein] reductase II
MLGISFPLIQGGLAYLARARLAAAVSNAGGLGQITAVTLGTKEALVEEIREFRRLSEKPFAVNIALGRLDVSPFIEAVIEEEVPAVTLTAGNPEYVLSKLQGTSVKVLVLVSTPKQAKNAERLGVDAAIAVGMEGGGHIGRDDIGSAVLIPEVARAVSIPVVASGGFMTGSQIVAALAMGAQGVEMGTRFVATKECVAHEAYKKLLVSASVYDTVVIERSLQRPGRALKTPYALNILEREQKGAGFDALLPLISGAANQRAALEGKLDEGFVWASQAVGLIEQILSVDELFDSLKRQMEEAVRRLNAAITL